MVHGTNLGFYVPSVDRGQFAIGYEANMQPRQLVLVSASLAKDTFVCWLVANLEAFGPHIGVPPQVLELHQLVPDSATDLGDRLVVFVENCVERRAGEAGEPPGFIWTIR